ncbi:protein-L-isoaspartate O-methyltransferase family protein [Cognatishimia maritima]|uniref:Protein-L-isoaspartate O-methyltransferase n=1 Tax=Cognatishimia maritima TaxID=870908 RepID=A0A1M5UZX1_9RHOB|nr:protein-L-isoaspartate O-methyltransferase [Cognatishimia maritima]SHH68476.1 protein-L-isoaspartate(D-aspartate) O-methyltransferase [Cognatishimia maritima]
MSDYAARRTAMVDTQVRPSDVTKFPIIEAMLTVPREAFVPRDMREAAYMGNNLMLEDGRVVLEARTLAKLLDALDIRQDELVLDIGAAYGYSSAVIARMAEAVIAVEDDKNRAAEAQTALIELNYDNVVVHEGALAEGAAEHGPYDVIVVQGGVEELPEKLAAQLKIGGRIACLFMSGNVGDARIGFKAENGIAWRSIFNAGAPVLEGFEREKAFQL